MDRRTTIRWLSGLGTTGLGAGLAGCLQRDDDLVGTDDGNGDDDPGGGNGDPGGTGDADEPDVASSGRSNWPTFGADEGHTGFRPGGSGPEAGTIAWSAIDDAPTVLCSPTVADGTVYVGSAADAVHAFDAATGDERWTFGTDSYVETAPTVEDGRVYAADADGVVYCVTTGGDSVWRHETGHNLHSRTLSVHDGSVYVGTAGTMPAVVSGETDGSRAGRVVALDADSGEQRWSFAGPEDWFSGPAVGDGRVYVGNHDGTVFALDAATGAASWSWSPSGAEEDGEEDERSRERRAAAVLAPPSYADGRLYVGLHAVGWVVALSAADGTVEWRTNLAAENVKSSPAVTDDRVYVGSHRVRAVTLDASDDGSDGESPDGTPTQGPGTYGRLYALSRTDGEPEWVHERNHDLRSSPAVVGDRVYSGGGDGAFAVTRADGEEVWRAPSGDFVDSSPAVAGGRLFVGSADGHLYCVGDG